MFDGLIAFGHSIASFLDPLSLGLILAVVARRRDHRCAAGTHRDDGRRADDHADDQDAVESGAARIDLHLRRRDLRRFPLGHPAQHSGHACLGGIVPRRSRARQAGTRRPRDGHRNIRFGARHADRHVLSHAVHADPGRPRAQVRCLRILLARRVRRHHRRLADRGRSAERVDRGSDRYLLRSGRARRHLRATTAFRSATAIWPAASISCRRWSARSASRNC